MEERAIRFGLLLSAKEKKALAQLAESVGGLSRGAMVRHLIGKEARRRGVWPSINEQQAGEENKDESN